MTLEHADAKKLVPAINEALQGAAGGGRIWRGPWRARHDDARRHLDGYTQGSGKDVRRRRRTCSNLGLKMASIGTKNGAPADNCAAVQFAPSLLMLDTKHVAGIIPRSSGSGAMAAGPK